MATDERTCKAQWKKVDSVLNRLDLNTGGKTTSQSSRLRKINHQEVTMARTMSRFNDTMKKNGLFKLHFFAGVLIAISSPSSTTTAARGWQRPRYSPCSNSQRATGSTFSVTYSCAEVRFVKNMVLINIFCFVSTIHPNRWKSWNVVNGRYSSPQLSPSKRVAKKRDRQIPLSPDTSVKR